MHFNFREFAKEYLSAASLISILRKGWIEGIVTVFIVSGVSALSHISLWVGGIGAGVAFIIGTVLGDKMTTRIEFFEDRQSAPQVQYDIAKAKEVWAIWHTAAASVQGALFADNAEHITKLMLLNPQSTAFLSLQANLSNSVTQGKDLRKDIEHSEKWLKSKGVKEIRHYACPILPMVIFNPSDKHAWIRVEPWSPFVEANERAIYIIRKNKNPKAFNALLKSFNQIWERNKGE